MVNADAKIMDIASPAMAILRRSNMSAIAPAGTATSISGSISAVCTSATILADDVSRVAGAVTGEYP